MADPRAVATNRGLPADRPGGNPNYKSSSTPDKDPTPPRPKGNNSIDRFKVNMSRARELVGNLAQTNHYLVNIPIPPKVKTHIEINYPDDYRSLQVPRFAAEKLGFLCSEASLPTSSYATAEVKDNFMGITQEFAHTRLYTDLDFTFYVDNDYSVMRFFEGWMDYISGGGEFAASSDPSTSGFRRFNFPSNYKVQNMEIIKFEKDYKTTLSYQFVNAFPKGLTPVPVSYGGADLLKVTVSFNYDRYLVKRLLNIKTIDDFVIEPYTSESTGSQSILAQLADQGAFGPQ